MKKFNEKVTVNGKDYYYINEPDFLGDDMCNNCICLDDEIDEDGYQKCYQLKYGIISGRENYEEIEDQYDWDNPIKVEEICTYNKEKDMYF